MEPGLASGHVRPAGAQCSKTAVVDLTGIAQPRRTVDRIPKRVARRLLKPYRRLAGRCRIGIDEICFRKGRRYVTVVVDHQTGRLLWAAEGRDEMTLNRSFRQLGRHRCRRLPPSAPMAPLGPTGPLPLPPGGHRS